MKLRPKAGYPKQKAGRAASDWSSLQSCASWWIRVPTPRISLHLHCQTAQGTGCTVDSVKCLPWRNTPHSIFRQEGPGLCDPEQCLPGEEHGGHGHRKVQTPLTKHHASHRVRNKSTFWPRSITHSLERAWLFWNSSSGNTCSWFRFSRLQERREGELDIARKSKGLFRKHWIQS